MNKTYKDFVTYDKRGIAVKFDSDSWKDYQRQFAVAELRKRGYTDLDFEMFAKNRAHLLAFETE